MSNSSLRDIFYILSPILLVLFIPTLFLSFVIQMDNIYAEKNIEYMNNPDNQFNITILWKKEVIINDYSKYRINDGNKTYGVSLEDFMIIHENKSYTIVEDGYHDIYKVIREI